MTSWQRRALHARAADQVIEAYQQALQSDPKKRLSAKGIAKGARVVAPSTCDFICDVELAANSVLTPRERALFDLVFLQGNAMTAPEHIKEESDRIKELVGREFLVRHIYPIASYFRGKAIK